MARLTPDELAERHPGTTGLLRYFEYDHLPGHLQGVSRPVGELAHTMVAELPDGPELTTGLRKLLEAKDCLVRAAIDATITRSAGWVAPNARDAVAGLEAQRAAVAGDASPRAEGDGSAAAPDDASGVAADDGTDGDELRTLSGEVRR